MATIPSCLCCGPVPWGPAYSGNLHLHGAPTGAPTGPRQAELVSFTWDQRWCLRSPHNVLGGKGGLPGVSEVWGARPAPPGVPVGAGPWPQGSGQCQLPLGSISGCWCLSETRLMDEDAPGTWAVTATYQHPDGL